MWGFALLPLDKDFDAPLCKTLSGSKQKPSEIGLITGVEFEKQDSNIISIFLELSCFDDLIGFKSSVEEECHDIDEASLWYGRRIGSKMMDLKRRQPS
nr:zinc finger ccch domain-containing protein 47 [Quercus suber]